MSKEDIRSCIGKRVKAIVVGANPSSTPKQQVMLVFDDDTVLEFWGESFHVPHSIHSGNVDTVKRYIETSGGQVRRVYE